MTHSEHQNEVGINENDAVAQQRSQTRRSASDEERVPLTANDLEGETGELSYDDDPLIYPPAPPAYYRRGENVRLTNFCRLCGVLVAVALACLSIAALIDVSSPRGGNKEPGSNAHSAAADSVLAAMDRSADPCENFYEYSCGSWLRANKIPLDRTTYSRSFSVVYDNIREEVHKLLEEDLQRRDNPHAKAGRFYSSCMRSFAKGRMNIKPLIQFRKAFTGFIDSKSFARALAALHEVASAGMFDSGVSINERHPTEYALYLVQGGLGLPHRNNYFSSKDSDVRMREKFITLIEEMLVPAGRADLISRTGYDELAKNIFEFEKQIASVTLPPESLRDPNKVYNPVKISDLPEGLAFDEYVKSARINTHAMNDTVILDNPNYYKVMGEMMDRISHNETWRQSAQGYLAFHLVRLLATKGSLGEDLFQKNFEFKKLVYGMKKLPERWKICQNLCGNYVGDAVGAAFVEKYFSEKRKKVAKRLAEEITKAFRVSLGHQDWMDAETRNVAKDKLDAINWKVGYTEKFDKYRALKVSKFRFSDNLLGAARYGRKKNLQRLGHPIDKTEWYMNAHDVNAYYSATRNEMVFPAGILQKPFFSDSYPEAMNYGSIGAVIGHEMSHGFDDQGRKYDKSGRLTTWWSKQSSRNYERKEKCYIKLYNTYKPHNVDIHVNGKLTLGENLADTNGVKVAFNAFKISGNQDPKARAPNPLLAKELSNHQLFFVAYAQTWCTLYRSEALKVQMETDPHSPGKFRVRGPLSQNPDFASAFECRNGSRYNPPKRCSLW